MQIAAPIVSWQGLDVLWFQVAGTLCNLTCTHCFISCTPHNHAFEMLSLDAVEQSLAESVAWGVKEYYFTGGEPFLNRELVPMLERTLDYGPASVLTNATVLRPEWLDRLRAADERSRYSLEFRVSIDGPTPETNDPIRGTGAFERAMQGVRLLNDYGFLPIITMTRLWDEADDDRVLAQFRSVLHDHGVTRPRLKLLPRLRIGAEERRTAAYRPDERLTAEMFAGYDASQLICSHSRVITSRGVWVCPILLDTADARLGKSLDDAAVPFSLSHGACTTCFEYGAICTNPSAAPRNVG
jgi:molybdenum cofactor biosynthesis enzyme MoaA